MTWVRPAESEPLVMSSLVRKGLKQVQLSLPAGDTGAGLTLTGLLGTKLSAFACGGPDGEALRQTPCGAWGPLEPRPREGAGHGKEAASNCAVSSQTCRALRAVFSRVLLVTLHTDLKPKPTFSKLYLMVRGPARKAMSPCACACLCLLSHQ